ncbi:hypothetical protein M8J75_016066 [Diaphorina citri]|nr:hypothetical protein M8J75_016066 [Diaphorina citri]
MDNFTMTFPYEGGFTNISFNDKEYECLMNAANDSIVADPSKLHYCPRQWDQVLCWPPTKNGSLAILPCFGELNGIQYDTSQNASKWCNANGSWNSFANYSLCTDIKKTTQDLSEPGIEITTMIYSVGYTLSLIALIIAVWIFVYFK